MPSKKRIFCDFASGGLDLQPKKKTMTPLKFNMEPEKQSLEKEIPNLETIIFRFHVKFRGSKSSTRMSNWTEVRMDQRLVRINGVIFHPLINGGYIGVISPTDPY